MWLLLAVILAAQAPAPLPPIDVPGIADATLPAWSEDGTRLACIERQGKRKFTLAIVDVSVR